MEISSTIRKYLGQKDFFVPVLDDGIETVEIVKKYEPDCIILDWLLQVKSSVEICPDFRKTPSTTKILILMLLSRGEDLEKVLGLHNVADDCISKTFQ